MQDYSKLLRDRSHKVGVWGAGFIGLSTMAHFARAGVESIAAEVSPSVVDSINMGEVETVGMREWLGFDLKPLVRDGLISATLDHTRLLEPDVLVHFVCIPTEKDGKPFNPYLKDVFSKLGSLPESDPEKPPLVIIESTLTPGTADKVVLPMLKASGKKLGKDLLLGIAPRRDWFVDETKSLKDLDRVFGGHDPSTTEVMRGVLGIVCDQLHAASSHRTAEMVKSFENAYRHMEITLANQLSLAYPDDDIREALQLVGTKWNIGTFYPGFGVGGYCIPLSSQYVIAGAEKPEELTILSDTLETDEAINRHIAASLIKRGMRNVGVMGLAYKANLKVSVLSPTVPFIDALQEAGVNTKLCDPYYNAAEIYQISGVESFDFPENVGEFDALVAVVDHDSFKHHDNALRTALKGCRFILDNHGIWSHLSQDFAANGIEYHISGDSHWLG